jgi:hypothetical protein
MSEADALPPDADAAIMVAARDTVLRRLKDEHARRGPDPDLPAAPPLRVADVPPRPRQSSPSFSLASVRPTLSWRPANLSKARFLRGSTPAVHNRSADAG